MPAGKGGGTAAESGGGESSEKNGVTRTSFRPPWVKEGPNPLPVPTMPWTLNKRSSLKDIGDDGHKLVVPQLRKVQKPEPQENGTPKKDTTFVKPQLKPIPPKEPAKVQSKDAVVPIKLNSVKDRELPPLPAKRDSLKDETLESIDKAMPATRNALVRQESMKRLSIPNAPPMPPPAPAMPKLIETDLNDKQKERLATLRSRPKTRPDWTEMLKEVESGRKLKHVECNDRSMPLLPAVKAKGQFLYESEKQNAHNELLKEIQQGFKLKRVKTNDRSKPVLEGLRKFRRQMTIEEQIQKSQSMASIPPEEIITDEADEMDDIDKVRDDLQSTKQLLALELRNKEAQIRDNKRLQARIQNLEAELEKAKTSETRQEASASSEADEKIIKNLKAETEEARKISEELEKKYTQAAEDLDAKKSELEEAKKLNRELEKKLQETLQGKRQSISADRKMSAPHQESEEEEEYEISESESDGSDNEEKRERRAQREVKLFRNKLKSFKNKEDNAKKERLALKEQMKKHQQAIKEEKKKYKALQKEVDKMASLMKDSSEDEEEEEEEEEEEKEESESESETSESESETSESETESEKSQSEPEDAPAEKIKTNLSQRTKRHENLLGALKKGNYLLKTNVERLQDDLNKQKELTTALQEDLDSVLAELG